MKTLYFTIFTLLATFALADDAHVWITNVTPLPQKETLLHRWDFAQPQAVTAWHALHDCKLTAEQNAMAVQSTGSDPYIMTDLNAVEPKFQGHLMVKIRGKGNICGGFSAYWATAGHPNFAESAVFHCTVPKMPETGDIRLPFYSAAPLTHLRLDFGSMPGTFYAEAVEIYAVEYPPLEVALLPHTSVAQTAQRPAQPEQYFLFDSPQTMRLSIQNPSETETVTATVNGNPETFRPGETRLFPLISDATKPVDRLRWSVKMENFPEIVREISVLHKVAMTDQWRKIAGVGHIPSYKLNGEDTSLRIFAKLDDSVFYICKGEKIIAAIENKAAEHATFTVGSGYSLTFTLAPHVQAPMEAPVLHIFSPMTYAALPGVELLEAGEWSSSKLDIITEAHKRFRPSPDFLTQQWMGIISTDAAFQLLWRDPTQQPTFAVPNYFDGTPSARMSLELKPGESVDLKIRTSTPKVMCANGLIHQMGNRALEPDPKVAAAAPAPEAMFALYRQALETGGIRNENGWGHCIESTWARHPFAGIASTMYHLTGEVPDFPYFANGGVHIPNDMIYFLSGRGQQALNVWRHEADAALREQDENGAYYYHGQFAEGHFEHAALGLCGSRAYHLLHAYTVTGEEKYLAAGLKTLNYMKRFNVARGAQCWEMPLHTPDPLAAAHAICAYTLAYRITRDDAHLEQAGRWAMEGMTYVYLWDAPDRPFQFGSYVGVLGATHWRNPLWIGRPVQWIGTVYAYALLDLGDATGHNALERQIAEAITAAGERQVYPDGPSAGLLPDSVDPVANLRFIYDINPSALVFLRLRLQGKLDGLDIRWNDTHRVVSPFRITELTAEKLIIHAPPAVAFQILINGELRDVPAGEEKRVIPLE